MERTFKSSIWALLVQGLVIYWGIALAYRVFSLLVLDQWIPIRTSTIAGGTVVLVIVLNAAAWWYRVSASDESIKGPNLWGGFTTVAFAPGLQFKETRILGFKYLKIWQVGESAIWAPLPLSGQPELYALLREQKLESA